jgi:heat shock protein HslJ
MLAPNFRLTGDLDGRDGEEAVVLLGGTAGGTGETLYLAVVARRDGGVINLATTAIGDRVQVRAARIAERRIRLDVVQAGASDAMCCPGDLVARSWELRDGSLVEQAPMSGGRLSVAALAGSEWVLRYWSREERAAPAPEVTLTFDGERIAGVAACNRYFAPVKDGPTPGDVTVGAIGTTRMLCPDAQVDAAERRFTQQLAAVRKLSFMASHLVLTYQTHGVVKSMLFERR